MVYLRRHNAQTQSVPAEYRVPIIVVCGFGFGPRLCVFCAQIASLILIWQHYQWHRHMQHMHTVVVFFFRTPIELFEIEEN